MWRETCSCKQVLHTQGCSPGGPSPWWMTCAEVGHLRGMVAMDSPVDRAHWEAQRSREHPAWRTEDKTHLALTSCTTRHLTEGMGRDRV